MNKNCPYCGADPIGCSTDSWECGTHKTLFQGTWQSEDCRNNELPEVRAAREKETAELKAWYESIKYCCKCHKEIPQAYFTLNYGPFCKVCFDEHIAQQPRIVSK